MKAPPRCYCAQLHSRKQHHFSGGTLIDRKVSISCVSLLEFYQSLTRNPCCDSRIDGQIFLIFVPPQLQLPIDGIRYQEQEQRYTIPLGNGRVRASATHCARVLTCFGCRHKELELMEIKFGFIPGQDPAAFRIRRRYRLIKGGHPQLILYHYSRGQSFRMSFMFGYLRL